MTYQILGIFALLLLTIVCTSALSANKKPATGLVNHQLRPCPSSPNCVCSEFQGHTFSVKPINYKGSPERAWTKAIATVETMGGKVIRDENGYLHATFTSRIFRFVDDLELRIDRDLEIIHLRSSSRTGFWDFGINKQRAARFRTEFRKTSD